MEGGSVHERYPGVLRLLASDQDVLAALGRAGPGWRRHVGRLSLKGPLATLVFERAAPGRPGGQEVVVAEAHLDRPRDAQAAALHGGETAVWLVCRPFPADPRMPALEALLEGPGERTAVRYRPGVRCTVRVRDEGVTRYAKVFREPVGALLHSDVAALWRAAEEGRLGFAVAAPQAFDPATGVVWQGEVPGEPVRPALLRPGGDELALRMGRALATLSTSGVQPADPGGPDTAMARMARIARDLTRHVPALGPAAEAVAERVQALHEAAGERPGWPIHGAARHPQWLLGPGGLGLIDFDRFGLGDREAEVATFQVGIEEDARTPVGLAVAFQRGYAEVAGPLDERLLLAHRAAARLRMARSAAQLLRPDAAARARDRLEGAVRALDEQGASA